MGEPDIALKRMDLPIVVPPAPDWSTCPKCPSNSMSFGVSVKTVSIRTVKVCARPAQLPSWEILVNAVVNPPRDRRIVIGAMSTSKSRFTSPVASQKMRFRPLASNPSDVPCNVMSKS